MIEQTLLNYLNDNLDGVKAYMQRPEKEPSSYVIIEKTGSTKSNHIKTADFAFQSIAGSLFKAADLNEGVKELIEDSVELDDIISAKLTTDYNFTNTATKQYRYQAVFIITHY